VFPFVLTFERGLTLEVYLLRVSSEPFQRRVPGEEMRAGGASQSYSVSTIVFSHDHPTG